MFVGLDHVKARTCVAAAQPTHVPDNAKGLASCYDVISMLEHQLRTARALLDELRERRSPVTQTSMSLVVDYCAELRAEAVEVVKASEMLQGEVCGPADSMRIGNAHGEVNALLERIKGHWAQLPRTRPDSKPHKALVDKIHVESAAYLKIADAARGAERKAARDDVPAG